MKRLPNYKIHLEIRELNPFINYNNTIRATLNENIYSIVHWDTKILEYNTETSQVLFLQTTPISQTTSQLVGRIVRNLPASSVMNYLVQNTDKRTIRRISRQMW